MKKITIGFVVQDYNDDGVCESQEFIAGDEVEWEDDNGNSIDVPEKHCYQSFDMIQPNLSQ